MRIDELQQLANPVWLPLASAIAKATFVLGMAALASLLLRRASAAVRHTVWTLGLAGALVLPALTLALPRWQVPVLTISSPVTPALDARHAVPRPERSAAIPTRRGDDDASRTESVPAAPAAASIASAPASRPDWPLVFLAIWAAGASIILARLALGLIAVVVMSRRTQRVTDAPWLPLARELALEIGITRRVAYLRSRSATMPMAWGIVRAAVLMPAEADCWPAERLRVVLLHELAHVKRRDCLTHVLAQLACAVYWFNPLAWMAARQVRTERERACDDLVLAAGTRGSDYANQLLEIARAMRARRFPAVLASATLAMAHRSQLEGRLMAILDTNLRRSEPGRVRTAIGAALVAMALLPLASVQPWAHAAAVETSTATPLPDTQPASIAAIKDSVREGVRGGVNGGVSGGVRGGDAGGVTEGVAGGAVEAVVEAIGQATVNPTPTPTPMPTPTPNPNPNPNLDWQSDKAVWDSQVQHRERKPADPKIVSALTAALKDPDKGVRESALHALVQMREPGIFEPLMQALADPSPEVRQQAAFGLGNLRDRRAVTPLIGALKDKEADVRQQAAFALGQLRDPAAVPELIAAMRDTDKDVRQQAAFALGQLRDPRAVEALISSLKDGDPDVQQQSAFALGQLRDRRAVEPLVIALKDANADVRQQSAFALGQLRDPRAIEGLTAALKDANAEVRRQAAFALGQIAH